MHKRKTVIIWYILLLLLSGMSNSSLKNYSSSCILNLMALFCQQVFHRKHKILFFFSLPLSCFSPFLIKQYFANKKKKKMTGRWPWQGIPNNPEEMHMMSKTIMEKKIVLFDENIGSRRKVNRFLCTDIPQ